MSIGTAVVSFKHDPVECLEDILENIAKIEGYLSGYTREMFEADDRTRDAAERCLERICEAVVRLGTRVTDLMPDQPSRAIRGMGNRLRHAYDDIETAMVWDTIQNDLPPLKQDAERALAELRSKQS
ncbi:MAG TPA: HepT-like ribonuclease domain-containing protein [Stellaceae bacterium]|jgi:uncharacterized protein with HEPN domain|nr:HepT-like ribonuclease domain-containing protein [Stellaceae bacterium]